MGTIASQITSLMIVYSTIYSDTDQRKHQSLASLAFVRGIHRRPVNSPHKWLVTRKMFPLEDVIMFSEVITIDRSDLHAMGSALDGAVFDIAQILAYLVHNMSRSQFYLGFGHFG